MTQKNQYDVIVAGAGPAGCAAAIALKQSGIDVCIIDRKSDETRKVGESLPGASIRLLNRLGIHNLETFLNAGDYKKCLANASSWGNEEWIYQSGMANPEGGGFHINRTAFDEALRKKAGDLGILIYNALVDHINFADDSENTSNFTIELKQQEQTEIKEIKTKWIIDATGRKASIRRKFGLERDKIDEQMAATNWIKAPQTDIDHATRIKSVADGWWYTSLLPDQSRVISFQSLPETIAKLHKNQEEFFTKFNEACLLPYIANKNLSIQSKAIDAGTINPGIVTAKGLLCVGDAALSFDPLSSQGIFFALYSGIKATESILKCISSDDLQEEILADYQSIIERVFIENQKSRKYFYKSESRYFNEPYWKSRKFS